MNHKLLFSLLLAAIFISGITTYIYAAEEDGNVPFGEGGPRHRQEMQMTDEERAQKLEELESMTFESWKQEQINRINSISEDDFNKMKGTRKACLENDKEKLDELRQSMPKGTMREFPL